MEKIAGLTYAQWACVADLKVKQKIIRRYYESKFGFQVSMYIN